MKDSVCNLIIDSCSELPRELCEAEGLTVLSFTYTEGNPELADTPQGLTGVDDMFQSISAHDFYENMRQGAMPMTSQPSQLVFEDAFRAALDTGRDTVYLAFSSGLSGCYEGACMAADRIAEERGAASPQDLGLYIVDLKLGSAPEGLLVAEAIRQRNNGLTASELAAWAEEARYYVHALFMVDDLTALKRGGRIPASIALAGTKLDVKPLLTFDIEGRLSMVGVVRGRKKGLRRMAEFYEKGHNDDMYSAIAAVGAADADEDADRLCELIAKSTRTSLFLRTHVGPTIGCHVGPGMICLSFWGEDRRQQTSISDRIAGKVRGR